MDILILGLLLWSLPHLLKRIAPGLRGRLGDVPGKMLVTVLSLAAIALMVIGYRRAEVVPLYTPLPGIGHLNNLLMLIAIFLLGMGHSRGMLRAKLRHPMLTGVIVWAVAHLLVNGDYASLLLFGGMGLWAVLEMMMINAQDGPWQRPAPGPITGDLRLLAITLVLYGAIGGIHAWLGYWPFG